MSTKRYRLLKDHISPVKRIIAGTTKTAEEWGKIFLGLRGEDFDTLKVWFDAVEDKPKFKWSGKMIKKFASMLVNEYFMLDVEDALQKFKSSHQSIKEEQIDTQKYLSDIMKNVIKNEERLRWSDRKKRDWEIVEIMSVNGKIARKKLFHFKKKSEWLFSWDAPAGVSGGMYEEGFMLASGNKIHSVKRLSDNEVFTVGDEICELGWFNSDKAVINSITIVNDYPSLNFGKNGMRSLMSAKKSKPQPTKERTEITFLSEFAGGCPYSNVFWSTKEIPKDKFQQINGLIESALNDDIILVYNQGNYQDIQCVTLRGEKFYSKKQVDEIEEAAWDAAREDIDCGGYATFQEYKKSK